MSGQTQKKTKERGRRGDGGVYLVVADEKEEFSAALRYAARRAEAGRAHVSILHVIDIDDFQHWSNVENKIRKELRMEAEKKIWAHAGVVNDLNGERPALYIREGVQEDVIVDVINEDEDIRALILGGAENASGPGSLVSYFTGKGLARLRIPVVIVPGHLDMQNIDSAVL